MAGERTEGSAKARIWRNARLATLAQGLPGLGIVEHGAVAARDGRIVFAGAAADMPPGLRDAAEIIDCERPLDHARPDRLPHPSRPCRQPRQRVRNAAGGRDLRGDRAGRRRHRLVGQGAARRERGRTCRPDPAAARCADRRRRDHHRDQVGLWPRPGERSQVAARRAPAWRTAAGDGAHDLPRRACAAAGGQRRQGRLYRPRRRADAAGHRRRGAGRRRRRLLRGHRLLARADGARLRRGQGARACRSSSMPTSFPISAARHWPRATARSRPIISNTPTRRALPPWPRPAPSPCSCPAPSISSARPRSRRSTLFRKHGVPMAVATDCNPGTSPLTSLLLTMNMAATLFPHDGRGVPRRRHPRGRARARPAGRNRHARSRQMGAISPSGTSSARPNSSTAWASIRSMPASGGDNDERLS